MIYMIRIAWSDAELKACGILCPIRRLTVEIQVWIKKCYQKLDPIINKEFSYIFKSIDKDENKNNSSHRPKVEHVQKDEYIQFNEQLCEFICMMCRSRGCRLDLGRKKQSPNDSESKDNNNNIANKSDTVLSHCFVPIGDFGNHRIGAKSMSALKYSQQRSHIDKTQHDFIHLQGKDLMSKKFFEYDFERKCVIVRSQEAILGNGEICYEYTSAPNWELLSNFGFCLLYNPYDRVIVTMTFSNNDPNKDKNSKRLLIELKMLEEMGVSQFLRKMDKTKYSLAIALTLQDCLPTVLLAANRVKLLNSQQLTKFSAQEIAMLDKLIENEYKRFKKKLKRKSGNTNKNKNKNDNMNDNDNESKNSKKKEKEKDAGDDDVEESKYNLSELCSLEWIVLKELKSNMGELLSHYSSEEPAISKGELKHEKGVRVVYKSIRQILTKCSITIGEKINQLSQVMESASSSESEQDD